MRNWRKTCGVLSPRASLVGVVGRPVSMETTEAVVVVGLEFENNVFVVDVVVVVVAVVVVAVVVDVVVVVVAVVVVAVVVDVVVVVVIIVVD